ncbi:MAG: cytochrome c3 family protein [Caldimicrobium sp.]
MHIFRPIIVFMGLVVLILIIRAFYVPTDFGIHERGYMYGWYRKSNEEEWKQVQVKFQGMEYCKNCHDDKIRDLMGSSHQIIQCENCHGPAINHPIDPPKLFIDKSRELCLRCHSYLAYPSSDRKNLKGIDPKTHNPDLECSMCHNPHKPTLGR